ncbi:MAG: hypothetical protein H6807_17425 [Planctomycetes bacterium]|nr:hypothetical protein [Planctomycetota bacterium]
MSRPSTIAAILLLAAGLLEAQRPESMKTEDWYPLGGLEAEALVATVDKEQGAQIMALVPGGLAEKGGLLVGDLILVAGGKKLQSDEDDDLIDLLCAQIERAEAGKAKDGGLAELDLIVLRAGKKEKIRLGVRAYPPVTASDPGKCKKTAVVLTEALDFLARDQREDGRPTLAANENQAVATAALSGLAWLGADREKYAEHIGRAADFVMKQAGHEREFGGAMRSASGKEGNWNQTNWSLGYGSIFLAEYLARQDDQERRARLEEMVKQLQDNQEQSGGWAHGPGGPNSLGYLELEIMSNFALGAMGMAQRLGIPLDDAKVIRGYQWVKACTTGGGVAYSPKPGQAGVGDPGRTAGALWALTQLDRTSELGGAMRKYYERGLGELYEGHACPTMHLLNGALASAIAGRKDFAAYWKVHRSFLMSLRLADGAFGYRPNRESQTMGSHPDRSWGPAFATAHVAIIMQLAQDRYLLLDRPPKSK